jgi:hypothetical protein
MSPTRVRLDPTRPLPTWLVRSSDGSRTYLIVRQSDGTFACNCPAGEHRRACKHVAAVSRSAERRERMHRSFLRYTPGVDDATRCFDLAHRSYSGDRHFDECQFRDRQFRSGLPDYMGSAGIVGRAVDAAVCAALAGQEPDLEAQVRAAIAGAGDPRVAHRLDEMTTKALALFDLWTNEVRPTWPPVMFTQLELHWREPDGSPQHAHLDVVFEDGSFTDLKTSEQRLGERRADTDPQLTRYALGLWRVFGHLPPFVGLDGLIYANQPRELWPSGVTKPKKPWWDAQRSTRTVAQLEALAAEMAKRERARKWADRSGIHLTQGRSSRYACTGCPVQPTCPAWAGYDLGRIEADAAA